MDKKEYKIRLEEIMTLIANNEFQKAAVIADKIDWREIHSFGTLEKISNLYKVNRRFDHAQEIAEYAYESNPINSNIVYSLCELAIELNQMVPALEYLARYKELAPSNPSSLILEYKIKEIANASLEEKIDVLEEYKRKDFKPEWIYQLAYLYHRVGLATKCIETCDELVTMMGDGPFVIKAMELKMLHTPLSKRQQEIYEARNTIKDELEAVESDEFIAETPEPGAMPELGDEDFHVKTIDMGKFNTINLQKALADSMKELLGEEEEKKSNTGSIVKKLKDTFTDTDEIDPFTSTDRILGGEVEELAEEPEEGYSDEYYEEDYSEEYDNEYDNEEYSDEEYDGEEYSDENYEEEPVEDENYDEVFFEDKTGDIVIDHAPYGMMEDIVPIREEKKSVKSMDLSEAEAIAMAAAAISAATGNTGKIRVSDISTSSMKDVSKAVNNMINKEEAKPKNKPLVRTIPRAEVENGRSPFDEVLAQENDGQISLAIPKENSQFEKQITGQMNFQEVLSGWEDIKKQQEKKFHDSISNTLMESTGKIFENYDNDSKNGILAQLEEEQRHSKRLIKNELELHKVDEFKKENDIYEEEEPFDATQELNKTYKSDLWDAVDKAIELDKIAEAAAEVTAVGTAAENLAEGVVEGAAAAVVAGTAAGAESIIENAAEAIVETVADNVVDDVAQDEENSKADVSSKDELKDESEDLTEESEENTSDDSSDALDISEEEKESEELLEESSEELSEDTEADDAEETDEYFEEEYSDDVEYEDGYYDEDGNFIYYDEEYADGYYDEDGNFVYYEDEEYIEESENVSEEEPVEEASLNTAQIADIGNVLEADADKVTRDTIEENNDDYDPSQERDFSVEEQELFADFMYSKKLRNQILEAVDLISLAPYVGNVIISGDKGTGTIDLAKSLIKEIQLIDANFISKKVAKISGSKMNVKDVTALFAQLANGALIIEKAGEMRKETLENITKALENSHDGIIVILADSKKAIDKMISKLDIITHYFNARVDITPMNDNALVEYAKKYAYTLEYKIDEERAVLALHQRIGELQIGDHNVTTSEVEEIVNEAIEHSKKFRISTVFKVVAGKRYDYEDMIILSEKDFV